MKLNARGVNYIVKTSVLSTLVVEFGFSIARGISDVFSIKQYNHIIARSRWDLLQQKSKDFRIWGMPTDNETGKQRVYGTVEIEVAPPTLKKKDSLQSLRTLYIFYSFYQ